VIAAAVAGVIAAFGGKKGFDYYKKRNNQMTGIKNNPLYDESGAEAKENPMFEMQDA